MIITIDGPAGAGKSTVARRLADRLGYRYLDTGAMYRVATLALLNAGVEDADEQEISKVASEADVEIRGDQVWLSGQDVTDEIRTPRVTQHIHLAADNPSVRQRLVELQRELAKGGRIICDGRDQGTVAFPDADCKIFLTASPQERARRRWEEMTARGQSISQEAVLADQNDRDERDATRPVGALRKADDAIEVSTDGLTLDEVVDRLVALVGESE